MPDLAAEIETGTGSKCTHHKCGKGILENTFLPRFDKGPKVPDEP